MYAPFAAASTSPDLLTELDQLTRARSGATIEDLSALRTRSVQAGDVKVAALCLHFIAQRTHQLSERSRIEHRMVRELPTSWAYAELATTERDRGRLRTSRRLFKEAMALLDPKKRERRAFLEQQLMEVEDALQGDRAAVDARIALRRIMLASARVTPDSSEAEFAKLKRHLRNAESAADESVVAIYLRGLADLAAAVGDRARSARYLARLATLKNTVDALEQASDEFVLLGEAELARRFAKKALEQGKANDSPRVPALRKKVLSLRKGATQHPGST